MTKQEWYDELLEDMKEVQNGSLYPDYPDASILYEGGGYYENGEFIYEWRIMTLWLDGKDFNDDEQMATERYYPTLEEAMENYVIKDGITLKEAMLGMWEKDLKVREEFKRQIAKESGINKATDGDCKETI